jgi:hypothetical protein
MTVKEVENLLGAQSEEFVGIVNLDFPNYRGVQSWPLMKAWLAYLDDPQSMRQFLARYVDEVGANPERLSDYHAWLDSYRRLLASKDGVQIAFLREEGGYYAVVCFGEGGRVRWAEWRKPGQETAPKTPFLDRARSWLGQ